MYESQANLKKKVVHHALRAIGITERNVQSLSIFGSRLLQDCLASGSPKLLLRQATCGRVPDEKMNDRCKPSKILETPVLMTRFSSRLKSPRPGSMQLATHLHHPFHAVFCKTPSWRPKQIATPWAPDFLGEDSEEATDFLVKLSSKSKRHLFRIVLLISFGRN